MSELEWNEDKGWGFFEPTGPCTKDYWMEYRVLDATPMGRVLTALRVGMVDQWVAQPLGHSVDVGIGGGAFVEAIDCDGIDVNPEAIAWLGARGSLWDGEQTEVMTFFDSIEHIENPGLYLSMARKWVFLSTPIYTSKEDCLKSKHMKPGEHIHYFEDRGIKTFMREHGFKCVDQNRLETDAGREAIGSYAFKRVS